MLSLSTLLKHYKQKPLQELMVRAADHREVAVKYGEQGFGKRPDMLTYPQDVLAFAQQGATSFHVSEEHWDNPLSLSTGLKKNELEDLRTGWDLVLDVDCTDWEYAKKITYLLVEELKAHNISSISVKFSGNKGFHIGVPFKAFPTTVHGKETRLLFPEGVRRIALYLRDRIEPKLLDMIKPEDQEKYIIRKRVCSSCGKEKKKTQARMTEFVCSICGKREEQNVSFLQCKDCNIFMEKFLGGSREQCVYCKGTLFREVLDCSELLALDTVLISSRHLYRSVYSLHEKSGLASLPIPIDRILSFDRNDAKPELIKDFLPFLDDTLTKQGEGTTLIMQAFDYQPKITVEQDSRYPKKEHPPTSEELTEAIPEDLFPPCIKLGLQGMRDGKKRFLFALLNFLTSCGYTESQAEALIFTWNTKNPEPLREVEIKGQIRYHFQQKKNVLPPNCDNAGYYPDLQLCHPDSLCARIKNPAQYAKRRALMLHQISEKSGREKLTEEQKAQRRAFRAKQKEKETNL